MLSRVARRQAAKLRSPQLTCRFAMAANKTDHAQRTATEPRDPSLHNVVLARVDEINPSIRTFRLRIPPPSTGIKFLPGQWLDVFVPGIERPGGFTITSPPSKACKPDSDSDHEGDAPVNPYLELAVQKSPDNVVAKWLWQPIPSILSSSALQVRVGGSFVWPPPGVVPASLRKIILIAGGVGINPLMSILSHLAEKKPSTAPQTTIHFLYSTRDPGKGQRHVHKILFLDRLAGIFDGQGFVKGELNLFLTPGPNGGSGDAGPQPDGQVGLIDGFSFPITRRRVTVDDIARIIGDDKQSAVVYLCGLPTMTDDFVQKLSSPDGLGLEPYRIMYEKWW